jgi:hypothetical protein
VLSCSSSSSSKLSAEHLWQQQQQTLKPFVQKSRLRSAHLQQQQQQWLRQHPSKTGAIAAASVAVSRSIGGACWPSSAALQKYGEQLWTQ